MPWKLIFNQFGDDGIWKHNTKIQQNYEVNKQIKLNNRRKNMIHRAVKAIHADAAEEIHMNLMLDFRVYIP